MHMTQRLRLLTMLLASGWLIVVPRPRPPATRVWVPRQSNMGGWYLHKPSNTWRHDGDRNPDTNYPDRQYLQLEDPEGVYERTKGAH